MTTINIENAKQVPGGLVLTTPTLASYLIVDSGKATIEDVLALVPARFITADATLDAADRTVVIDAAGTVIVTLDTGSATRAPVEILRKGTGGLHGTVFTPPSGGTINGGAVDATLTVYATALDGESYRLWSSAPLTWHVDTAVYSAVGTLVATTIPALDTRIDALEVTGRQVITTSTATILPGTRVVYIDHNAARTDLTLPATPFEPFTIKKRATSGGFGVRLIPASASDAIQGLAANTNFDISWMTTNASTTTARPAAFVSSSVVNVVDVA